MRGSRCDFDPVIPWFHHRIIGVQVSLFFWKWTADEITRTVIRTERGVIFDWCLTNGGFDLEKENLRMFTLVSEGIRSK